MKPYLRLLWGTLLLTLAISSVQISAAPRAQEAPSSYRDYATANDTSVVSRIRSRRDYPRKIEVFDGTSMTPNSWGARREQETKDGYLTMESAAARTSLRVPLGWHAFDSPPFVFHQSNEDTLKEGTIQSPDKKIRIIARSWNYSPSLRTNRRAFELFQPTALAQVRARLREKGFDFFTLKIEKSGDESFAVSASGLLKQGQDFGFLEIFKERATPAERQNWWRENSQSKRPDFDQIEPLSVSLLAPLALFDHYSPLLNLIARDEGIHHLRTRELTAVEFRAQMPDAAQIVQLADQTVAQIKAGNVKPFAAHARTSLQWLLDRQVSPEEMSQYRREAAEEARERLVPFFRKLPVSAPQTAIRYTYDRDPQFPHYQISVDREYPKGDEYPAYVTTIIRDRETRELFVDGIQDYGVIHVR